MVKEVTRFEAENESGVKYDIFILTDGKIDGFYFESDNPEKPDEGPLGDNLEDAKSQLKDKFPDAEEIE